MLAFLKLGSFRAALGLSPTVEYVRLLADANDAEVVWPPSIHFPEVVAVLSNRGLELTLRSAVWLQAFALQLTPLGLHLGSRSSNPSR
jgi:hypothetical protein